MKYIRIISRILVGIVFIFSGFVKGIDPMGSAIKFSEYFETFHLTWLGPISLVLSIMLSTAEFLIGVSLLMGLRMRVTAWAALLFMSFFTLVTLFIAIKNPVTDCGCFGDALVITNWQTFYKNIVLIGFAIFIFYSRNKYIPYANPLQEWVVVFFFASVGAGISVYCYRHLPIMDFRPYSIGTNIPSKMIIPPDAPKAEDEMVLYYEKNGVVKEFPMINNQVTMPDTADHAWVFKESKRRVIKEAYKPPIHDFSINTEQSEDITNTVLADTSYSFLFLSYNADKVTQALWKEIEAYDHFAEAQGHKFYMITSSTKSATERIKSRYHLNFNFYFMDETTLKTIIRADPGLVLLKHGTVLGMWHYNDFPETGYFKGDILSKVLTDYNKSIEWKRIFILMLAFGIVIMALYMGRRKGV